MTQPRCPHCSADISVVRPVRIKTDPDSRRWEGEVPDALGFVCVACSHLLPLSPIDQRGEP